MALILHGPAAPLVRCTNVSIIRQVVLLREYSTSNLNTNSTPSSTTEKKPLESVASKAFTCQSKPISEESTIPKPTFTANLVDRQPRSSPRKHVPAWKCYLALTKPRLTALVVLSAMSSYALTPYDATLSQLVFLTAGTALTSGAANAINMGREHIYDGLMSRTQNRPVVRGYLGPNDAFKFSAVSGALGVAALYFGVNPTVAMLGAGNIALYSWMYTSLKRKHVINTWVGALVGAIPPLMGWASSSSLADPGAWLLASLLFAWQFPHFNSLSHNIRDDYRRAGYVMAAWTNPALNARVALRYSALMFPICFGLSYYNVTDWLFCIDSSILNGWLTFLAYKFWREQRNVVGPILEAGQSSGSPYARKLFWGSVLQLPGILVLAMLHKKGQWDWLFGDEEEEEGEEM